MDAQALISCLQIQRNNAMDSVAELHGHVAEKDKQIAQLQARITELEKANQGASDVETLLPR